MDGSGRRFEEGSYVRWLDRKACHCAQIQGTRRHGAYPRRQVDFPSRPDARRACGRPDAHCRPARRRGCHQHRHERCGRLALRCARKAAPGSSTVSATAALLEPEAPLDFGNAGTGCRLTMGLVGAYDLHHNLRRRCLAFQTSDGPRTRSACARWAFRWRRPEGGRLPVTLRGPKIGEPGELSRADGLGPGEIRRAARGSERTRHHHGDRAGDHPRSYRERCCRPSARTLAVETGNEGERHHSASKGRAD